MGKSPSPPSVMMLRFFMGLASLSTAKTIFSKRPRLPMSLRFGDSMPSDGNRLSDIVAAIFELRHSQPWQRRVPLSSSGVQHRCPGRAASGDLAD
jgi:hypothetical protein